MRGVVALALGLALALAACGSGQSSARIAYDRPAVERYLAGEVARVSPGLAIGAVTCPTQMADGVGATTTCAVAIDGVTTTYVVQVLAGKRFEARPENPIVDLRKVIPQIVEKAGSSAAVNCGTTNIVQLKPGQRVICSITNAGPPRRVVVTADPSGAVRVADA